MRQESAVQAISLQVSNGEVDNYHVNCSQEPPEEKKTKMAVGAKLKQFVRKSCTLQNMRKKLPITLWIPKYKPSWFLGDLVAGLTVGLTVLPQGLAYAQIAELPAQYGLYSAFMGCFVYCFLGTSKDITLGPTAIMSLMTADFAHSPTHDATYAIILTLMCGVVQLLLGIFHLGFLVNFISFPVISGFTSAAAIVIGFSQVKKVLGLTGVPRQFLSQVYWTFKKIPETNVWDLTMGLVCLVILLIMKKVKDLTDQISKADEKPTRGKKIARKIVWLVGTSRNAIVVIAASGVAAGLLSLDIDVLTLTGEITPGLPEFKVPDFTINTTNITRDVGQVFSDIGGGFGIIPLIGLLETIAIGSAFAPLNNYRIDASQELVALGAANIISSFVSSYPVAGSFSRTAVNSQSGVKTPAGGIWTGILVIIALLVLTPYFTYIPDAALAAVIIAAVIQMVDVRIILHLWRIKKIDLLPLFTTFILSLVLDIEYGILIGIGVSVLILLFPMARPTITIEDKGVIILRPDQGLRFPATEYLKQKMLDKAWTEDGERMSCVLDCTYMSGLDYTSVQGISQLYLDFGKHGARIVLAAVKPDLLEILIAKDIKEMQVADSVEQAIQMLEDDAEQTEDLEQTLLPVSQYPGDILRVHIDESSSLVLPNGTTTDKVFDNNNDVIDTHL